MISQKYWYKLLSHYYQKNYFTNGLTLPYIIGARSILEPNERIQTVKELLEDIKASGTYLSVLNCGNIGEYVFSISNKSDFDIYGGFDNIVDIDSEFQENVDFSQFCELLENKYSNLIDNNLYSRNNNGDWEQYSRELDLHRLNEIT